MTLTDLEINSLRDAFIQNCRHIFNLVRAVSCSPLPTRAEQGLKILAKCLGHDQGHIQKKRQRAKLDQCILANMAAVRQPGRRLWGCSQLLTKKISRAPALGKWASAEGCNSEAAAGRRGQERCGSQQRHLCWLCGLGPVTLPLCDSVPPMGWL